MTIYQTMIVKCVDDEGDRVLLYATQNPKMDAYHVIAPAGYVPPVDEPIIYEPCGMNFGFLVDATNASDDDAIL